MTVAKVLLINGLTDRPWIELLQQAAASLGRGLMVTDHREWKATSLQDCDLIIVDASVVADVVSLIRRIRSCDPRLRVLVVTPTPHWKQAREALLAGAIDYVRKVEDKDAVQAVLQGSLSRKAPVAHRSSLSARVN